MTLAKNRSAVIAIVLVALCGGQWGCAIPARPAPEPLSDEVRAQLKTVGVPAAPYLPDFQLEAATSGKGWGALKGAGYGVAAGAPPGLAIASVAGRCGGAREFGVLVCGSILLLGLGTAVAGGAIGALGGTLYGAVTAEPAWKISAAETDLRSAFVDLNVQSTLRDHVLQAARQHSSLNFVGFEHQQYAQPSNYRVLAMTHGIDTVLEVDVSSIRLAGRGIDPPMKLVMTASTRLVRISDSLELHSERFAYHGQQEYKFVEWAADGSRALREEVDRGARALASEIVQRLFQSDPARESVPTPDRSDPDAEDTEPVTED